MNIRTFSLLLIGFCCSAALAQLGPGSEFSSVVSANERFGKKLLQAVESLAPGQNVVVSPLPLWQTFALLRDASDDSASLDQIDSVFGWSDKTDVEHSNRMLVALFSRPVPPPATRNIGPLSALLKESPQELWTSAALLYQGNTDAISGAFVERGKRNYGVSFRRVSAEDLNRGTKNTIDFRIDSTTHLRTSWADNTFSMGTQKRDKFVLSSGEAERVPVLVSQTAWYRHGAINNFEAVELLCDQVYIEIAVPEGGTSISELESELVRDDTDVQFVWKYEIGDVEIPSFSFKSQTDAPGHWKVWACTARLNPLTL